MIATDIIRSTKKILISLLLVGIFLICACTTQGDERTITAVYTERTELFDNFCYDVGSTTLFIPTDDQQPMWVLGHVYRVTFKVIFKNGILEYKIINWEEVE